MERARQAAQEVEAQLEERLEVALSEAGSCGIPSQLKFKKRVAEAGHPASQKRAAKAGRLESKKRAAKAGRPKNHL